jgi:hypothetical protein
MDGLTTTTTYPGLDSSATCEKVCPAYYTQVHDLNVENDVTVIQTLGRIYEATRGAASDLEAAQSAACTRITRDDGYLYQYTPSILPLLGITSKFQLVYPATGVATATVTLRAPNLGNKDRLGFNRVLRETRGGTLIVYADPIWPQTQTLALSFSGLTRTEAQNLLTFLETYLGLEIGLLDWEQRYWKGVIMTPDHPVIEDSRGRFSASFEFEGELDSTWAVANLASV